MANDPATWDLSEANEHDEKVLAKLGYKQVLCRSWCGGCRGARAGREAELRHLVTFSTDPQLLGAGAAGRHRCRCENRPRS